MDIITKIFLFIFILSVWILWGLILSYTVIEIHNETKEEHDSSKYKFIYLLKLCLEGPFMLLRLKKK